MSQPERVDKTKPWRVKDGTGEDLIDFWKRAFPISSSEVAAADIIEQLERELAEAKQRSETFRIQRDGSRERVDALESKSSSADAGATPDRDVVLTDVLHEASWRGQSSANEALAAVLKAINDEPEFPGEPPAEMMDALRSGDDALMIAALRIAVIQTKDGIRERVQEALGVSGRADGKS